MTTPPRYLEWASANRYLTYVHSMLVDLSNGLGIVDVRLIEKDDNPQALFRGIERIIEMPLDLEHRTLSMLWVLGAYELVRTLSRKVKSKPELMDAEAKAELDALKLTLEQLRMPIAKLERAHRGKEDGFEVAFPVLDGRKGISWTIGPNQHISRRELSDSLLGMLKLAGRRLTTRCT